MCCVFAYSVIVCSCECVCACVCVCLSVCLSVCESVCVSVWERERFCSPVLAWGHLHVTINGESLMGTSVSLFYMKPSSPLPSIPLSSLLFSSLLFSSLLFSSLLFSSLLFSSHLSQHFLLCFISSPFSQVNSLLLFSRDFQLISSFLCNFFHFSHIFSCCLVPSHFLSSHVITLIIIASIHGFFIFCVICLFQLIFFLISSYFILVFSHLFFFHQL